MQHQQLERGNHLCNFRTRLQGLIDKHIAQSIEVVLVISEPHARLPFATAKIVLVSRPQDQDIPIINLEKSSTASSTSKNQSQQQTLHQICNHTRTKLTEESLRLMRLKYDIVDDVEMMLPKEHERPGWFLFGWYFF